MLTFAIVEVQSRPRRTESSSGMGGIGCFLVLLIVGVVIFLVMRGRRDRQEQLGASHRPMSSAPVGGPAFASPYAKCGSCGAPGDKMKSSWDGMRKVTWTCGYCNAQAGIQELKDEELPASARQRLGLDGPAMMPGQQGYPQGPGGLGGVGGLLGGMMIGSMMSGGGHHHHDGSTRRSDDGGSGGSDWGGDSGGSDWGDSGGGGSDWGDSGGGDSGGGDSGGGDW